MNLFNYTMNHIMDERERCDLECLLNGSFAPLTSYMTHSQYTSCLDTLMINGSDVFPIPIVLMSMIEVPLETVVSLKSKTGITHATLTVKECWQPDLRDEWISVFGTDDDNHPYIKYVKERIRGCNTVWYLSGELSMVNTSFHDTFLEYRRSPNDLKTSVSGPWLGFQTRNPLHRSHVELIRNSAKQCALPVLLHPVEGVTQECDVPFPVRMKCYQNVLTHFLGQPVTLSILSLSMRMAGPREAVWHAVIRRNYGCSHFIVGRDHAGPSYRKKDGSTFYAPLEAQQLALLMESKIGITIVPSEELVYCEDMKTYMPVSRTTGHVIKQISGTRFRSMLEKAEEVPSWYSYSDIIQPLQDFYQRPKGLCVYFMGLSGAGKSTLASKLRARIQEEMPHKEVTILDADEIRMHLSKGLGFSKADRSTNVRRIGYVASEIVRHGGIVLVANIAPFQEDRAANRTLIEPYGRYVEVYVNTAIEECERRDVKGLYKAARAGTLGNFTGISDPFEVPSDSEIVLTGGSIEEQVEKVCAMVLDTPSRS